MYKIIIDTHSFLDVITNSSSELFICDKEQSIEFVKEMLHFMLDKWNEMAVKGAFGDWYIKNKRISLNTKKEEIKPIKTFEEVFGNIYIYTKERQYQDTITSGDFYKDMHDSSNIGKIFIESAEDNSIPFEIFDWIESAFNATRYHLG